MFFSRSPPVRWGGVFWGPREFFEELGQLNLSSELFDDGDEFCGGPIAERLGPMSPWDGDHHNHGT